MPDISSAYSTQTTAPVFEVADVAFLAIAPADRVWQEDPTVTTVTKRGGGICKLKLGERSEGSFCRIPAVARLAA